MLYGCGRAAFWCGKGGFDVWEGLFCRLRLGLQAQTLVKVDRATKSTPIRATCNFGSQISQCTDLIAGILRNIRGQRKRLFHQRMPETYRISSHHNAVFLNPNSGRTISIYLPIANVHFCSIHIVRLRLVGRSVLSTSARYTAV